jgi:hypothetical protein
VTSRILVSAGRDHVMVDADTVGLFAIHRSLPADTFMGKWVVTHIPTGWYCLFTKTKRAAHAARKAYLASTLDWSFTDPRALQQMPAHREVGLEIKAKWQGK